MKNHSCYVRKKKKKEDNVDIEIISQLLNQFATTFSVTNVDIMKPTSNRQSNLIKG